MKKFSRPNSPGPRAIVPAAAAPPIRDAAYMSDSDSKPRKQNIPKTLKIDVWNHHVGEEIGKTKCLCCKTKDITQLNFHCGHVLAEAQGGRLEITNLRPICASCNLSMGTMHMDEFIKKYGYDKIRVKKKKRSFFSLFGCSRVADQ